MSTWMQIFYILIAAAFVWFIYTRIKHFPKEMFSKESIHKSIYVTGMIALGLIIFIWILVKLLQMS